MSYHPPRVYRPLGSVGVFGTNNPEDVKALQRMIINAGYNHISGNHIRVTGHNNPETEAAIIWYQRLLNISPSGLIHPRETWFYTMFSHATNPRWRPRLIAGPLHVNEGQITFDAEGLDYITATEPFRQPENTRNFSRILHCPDSYSGVTLGRGYDMKERSAGEILTHFRTSGIEEYKAVICSRACGLKGGSAKNFIKYYGPLVGEITHLQQIKLFEISYRQKKEYAKGVYLRQSKNIPNPKGWDTLDKKIRETFVDIVYQGIPGLRPLIELIAGGGSRSDVAELISNDPRENGYPERLKARLRNLQ